MDLYMGHYKNNLPNGLGKSNKDSYHFTGSFENGLKEGQGYEIDEKGNSYCGNFHLDLRDGMATKVFLNGDSYSGQFEK